MDDWWLMIDDWWTRDDWWVMTDDWWLKSGGGWLMMWWLMDDGRVMTEERWLTTDDWRLMINDWWPTIDWWRLLTDDWWQMLHDWRWLMAGDYLSVANDSWLFVMVIDDRWLTISYSWLMMITACGLKIWLTIDDDQRLLIGGCWWFNLLQGSSTRNRWTSGPGQFKTWIQAEKLFLSLLFSSVATLPFSCWGSEAWLEYWFWAPPWLRTSVAQTRARTVKTCSSRPF